MFWNVTNERQCYSKVLQNFLKRSMRFCNKNFLEFPWNTWEGVLVSKDYRNVATISMLSLSRESRFVSQNIQILIQRPVLETNDFLETHQLLLNICSRFIWGLLPESVECLKDFKIVLIGAKKMNITIQTRRESRM